MTDHRIICGDSLHVLPTLDAESVDAIVCDPPYGLSFMGKEWDHGVPGEAFWREAWRVAKPGAHLLAFGGTRTYHRLACAIEDAGWEIRDCLSWLYGSGFPKSHNLDGEKQGWGTALKPAWEPIIVARKPLVGTVASNVAQYGTGAMNVDGCRIGTDEKILSHASSGSANSTVLGKYKREYEHGTGREYRTGGRWPANVVLDEDAAAMLDAQSGYSKSPPKGSMGGGSSRHRGVARGEFAGVPHENGYGDSGGASRFFYTAKASRREREAGLEGMPEKRGPVMSERCVSCGKGRMDGRRVGPCCDSPSYEPTPANGLVSNHHPTVKPIALMRWLCRLVTPPNGLVLDPFTGSGSTGCAAVLEGCRFVGIEREPEYAEIARRRIAHWAGQVQTPEPSLFDG